jgi:hypothetical protein
MSCFGCCRGQRSKGPTPLPPRPTLITAKNPSSTPIQRQTSVKTPTLDHSSHSPIRQRDTNSSNSRALHTITMAPGLQVGAPSHPLSPTPGTLGLGHWKRVSGGMMDFDSFSNGGPRSVASRRASRKTVAGNESSAISNVVYSLKRRSGDELGATTSSKLLNSTHATLLDWIRHQRMSKLPPEGSSYDKVLAWAQLFVERLHSFDLAIENFAGDSYLAAQLAYGYCAILLEVRFSFSILQFRHHF